MRYVADEPKQRCTSGPGRRRYTAEHAMSPGAIDKKDEETKEGGKSQRHREMQGATSWSYTK